MSGEAFTLEKLLAAKRLVDAMPPCPVFAKWDQFPRDHAIRFQHEGREHVGAHPEFWDKIPASTRGQATNIGIIEIIDLSLPYYAEQKAAFLLAMRRWTLAALARAPLPPKDTAE